MPNSTPKKILEVKDLCLEFESKDGPIPILKNLSYAVEHNQSLGLVGESGSGKSMSALTIMGLLPPTARITSGKILWKGQDLLQMTEEEKRGYRGRDIGLIFQNPLAALNPVFTVASQMIETIQLHHEGMSKADAETMAIDFLNKVKIPDAARKIHDYPHQFSLGMCQRVMIAMTLSMNPSLIIADEPTASLDVTVQAEILRLLDELKADYDLSILFISHDLSVVANHCEQIVVMNKGRIVEHGNPDAIFGSPKDPYTQRLISSIPNPPAHVYGG